MTAIAAFIAFSLVAKDRAVALAQFQETASAEIATANARAAEANERSLKLDVEAASQRERAAKAEATLLELQQRVNPRRIVGTRRDEFVSALKPYALRRRITEDCGRFERTVRFAKNLQSMKMAASP